MSKSGRASDVTRLALGPATPLPDDLRPYRALEHVIVEDSRHVALDALVDRLGQVPSLSHLTLGGADLTELPARLPSLRALVAVTLVDCPNLRTRRAFTLLARLPDLRLLTISQRHQYLLLDDALGELDGLRELVLRGRGVFSVPDGLGRLRALERLRVERTAVRALPRGIGGLEGLVKLWAGDNRLATLPAELGRLGALRLLSLRDNRLHKIPDAVAELRELRVLDLSGNARLRRLNERIGTMPRLEVLDLRGTGLTHAPSSLAHRELRALHLPEGLQSP
jgi:leucine-rich repeat protein SHOC2